jgi:glycosyltransferase involved in cell wall biosynthesis
MKLALSILCENPHRPTGLSTLFHEFVAHALRQYPQVKWIVFAGPDQPWLLDGARVEVVRCFPSNEHRLRRLRADHFGVARKARERGAEALLTVGFVPVRTSGLPVIMHLLSLHHRRPGGGLRAIYRRAIVQSGLRRAALVVTNSQWAASQLGQVTSRLVVSYEGLQHDRFGASGACGTPEFPPGYLLWVGNFYPYKRAELALAAYARLPEEIRERCPFVMVGGDWEGGAQRASRLAEGLGLGPHVKFSGWVPDDVLPALYRGARAHVLSTSEETFGRSVAEAMSSGCPCVVQDLTVLREVTDGAALFTDFADPWLAGEALRRVCTDDALCEELRQAGLRRAAAFRFEKLTRERVDAILRILPKCT